MDSLTVNDKHLFIYLTPFSYLNDLSDLSDFSSLFKWYYE